MSRPVYKEEWPEFEFLSDQVINIWFEKKLFDSLFKSDDDTIHLMNRGAREFFVSLQHALPMNLLRALSAVYDNPKTGNNANVTMEALVAQSRMWCCQSTFESCGRLIKSCASANANLRKFRNKKLAHYDRESAINGKIYGVNFSEIDTLAQSASDILNLIQGDLFKSQTAYKDPIVHFPADILSCIKSHLWVREMSRLIREGHLSEQEAGKIMRYGKNQLDWRQWCTSKDLNPNYYALIGDLPEQIR